MEQVTWSGIGANAANPFQDLCNGCMRQQARETVSLALKLATMSDLSGWRFHRP